VGFFSAIIDFVNNLSHPEQIMAGALLVLFVMVLILRISLFSGYKGGTILVTTKAKSIKSKEDVEKLSGGTFGRIAREYAVMAAAGGRVDALALSQLAVAKNRLLFFNFKSLAGFVQGLERTFPVFAILFALVAQSQAEFIILAAVIFLLTLIFAAIFDVEGAKDQYVATLAHVLAKDIGRLYPADAAAAVHTFGGDLKEYLSRQSVMYNEVLNKINSEFTGAITANISTMTRTLDTTLTAIANQEHLDASVAKWSGAIDKAAQLQKETGSATEKIGAAMVGLTAALETTVGHFGDHSRALAAGRDGLKADMKLLTDAVQRLNQISANMEMRNEAVGEGLALVRENQKALEQSVAQYEISMKELTSQIGDAFGKIISHHLNDAGGHIANGIADTIKQAVGANEEQAQRIKGIFEEINEQSRCQTRLLMNLSERLGDEE